MTKKILDKCEICDSVESDFFFAFSNNLIICNECYNIYKNKWLNKIKLELIKIKESGKIDNLKEGLSIFEFFYKNKWLNKEDLDTSDEHEKIIIFLFFEFFNNIFQSFYESNGLSKKDINLDETEKFGEISKINKILESFLEQGWLKVLNLKLNHINESDEEQELKIILKNFENFYDNNWFEVINSKLKQENYKLEKEIKKSNEEEKIKAKLNMFKSFLTNKENIIKIKENLYALVSEKKSVEVLIHGDVKSIFHSIYSNMTTLKRKLIFFDLSKKKYKNLNLKMSSFCSPYLDNPSVKIPFCYMCQLDLENFDIVEISGEKKVLAEVEEYYDKYSIDKIISIDENTYKNLGKIKDNKINVKKASKKSIKIFKENKNTEKSFKEKKNKFDFFTTVEDVISINPKKKSEFKKFPAYGTKNFEKNESVYFRELANKKNLSIDKKNEYFNYVFDNLKKSNQNKSISTDNIKLKKINFTSDYLNKREKFMNNFENEITDSSKEFIFEDLQNNLKNFEIIQNHLQGNSNNFSNQKKIEIYQNEIKNNRERLKKRKGIYILPNGEEIKVVLGIIFFNSNGVPFVFGKHNFSSSVKTIKPTLYNWILYLIDSSSQNY